MSFGVRLATVEDAAAIAKVQVESWRTTYPGIVPDALLDGMTVEEQKVRWAGQLGTTELLMYVAQDAGGVFGFACGGPLREAFGEYDAELYAIYILQARQREGVGRALTRKLAEVLQNRGFKSLLVWVLEGNPSMGFYERLGGVRETRRVIHLGGKDLPECSYGWPKMEKLA